MVFAHHGFTPLIYLLPPAFFLLSIFLLSAIKNKKENILNTELEDAQGRINIAYQQLELEESRSRALRHKLTRYEALALLCEKLNQNLSLAEAVAALIEQTFLLLGQENSLCLVYLVGPNSDGLSLVEARGEASDSKIIKEKHGDMFDQWLIRHSQPLLVEDLSNDFRFDGQEFKKTSGRRIGSLISSCFTSQSRPTGIVRLESPRANSFNLEDLRLLNTIADIASVAIDNARYYQRIRELAIKDSLTSLFTRAFIFERLDEEIKRSMLNGDPLTILMIDIDFFKKYNDTYGHPAGDAVLKSLSQWLRVRFESRGGLIGRYGGGEFLVILPSTAKQEAFLLAEDMRAIVQERAISLRRKPTRVTLSTGIASFPLDAQDSSELIAKADSALYEAKKTGRNRVCIF